MRFLLLERRLVHCFAAATALLAASSFASASVVTRQVNAMLTATPDGPNNDYALDVNQDGVSDFTFQTIIADPADPGLAAFAQILIPFGTINGEASDSAVGSGFAIVSKLAPGGIVGPASTFSGINDNGGLFLIDFTDPASGNFNNASGYVGLKFASGADTLYGFAYVTVNDLFAATNPLAITIGQVGFETTPGLAITLPPVAVPEPVSGCSFFGAVALLSTRRRTRTSA